MPVRVYDIAKRQKVDFKTVLAVAKELGIRHAKVPSSSLDKITGEFLEEKVAEWIKSQSAKNEAPKTSEQTPVLNTLEEWKRIDDLPNDWQSLVNPSIVEQVSLSRTNCGCSRNRRAWGNERGNEHFEPLQGRRHVITTVF